MMDKFVSRVAEAIAAEMQRSGDWQEVARAALGAVGIKQSSPEMSSLAGRYLGMDEVEFVRMCRYEPGKLFAEVRSLAGSVVSQDQTKGQ